jgi:two-component system, NtrC family, nitrogen regulation sensor histidine kinase GlnL
MFNKAPAEYRQILDSLTDAVFLFNGRMRLTYVNYSGEQLLGGSSRHFLDMSITDVFKCPEIDIESDFWRCMDSGVSFAQRDIVVEFNDTPITVNIFFTPLFERHECTSLLVEIHQIDRHLRISREEQQLSQQHASRLLLRGLAHEVKNPLGGIRGAAQLLDQELNGKYDEYTRVIIDESDRLQELLDRIVGPNKPPRKSRTNIHKILERVRQLVQAEVPKGVTIDRDYDPSIPDLNCDPDQLIQALLNIVRNAAQAVGNQGEIMLRTRIYRHMTIGARRHKLTVKIDIVDSGPGIPKDIIGQIFYPLVTGRAEGTGLGLSIAQSLVNQHGGLIECTSSPGNTVFSIFLPLGNGNE